MVHALLSPHVRFDHPESVEYPCSVPAMYSTCIFCSQLLGSNDSLETFPVGELIAFDAWKGRLWAVCPRCGRWNLAPIEERWEAVEEAERQFRGTRLRVQSENIGIAQLLDGTRLVRVGEALPGELAAWRYGTALRQRRRSHRREQVVGALTTLIMPEAALLLLRARRREVVYFRPATSRAEQRIMIRERDLNGARIVLADGDQLAVSVTPGLSLFRRMVTARRTGVEVELRGRAAHDLLARVLVRVNAAGASDRELHRAREAMERVGTLAGILTDAAGGSIALAERRWSLTKRLQGRASADTQSAPIASPIMLALEMLLHEEAERRALAGDLEALREQWRQAEEIAAIADGLLDPPLSR